MNERELKRHSEKERRRKIKFEIDINKDCKILRNYIYSLGGP